MIMTYHICRMAGWQGVRSMDVLAIRLAGIRAEAGGIEAIWGVSVLPIG